MRLSDVDLRLLRVFKAVAEAGGFVRAQDTLGISQPAISARIANLEDRLNQRLCIRGRQGFSLTDKGQEVLEETNRLLDFIDESAARLSKIGSDEKPQLRIGIVDCAISEPQNNLVQAIREFHRSAPGVAVKIGIYDLFDCQAELRSGRLDLAILGFAEEESVPEDFEAFFLFEEVSGLFCAPDHPCSQPMNDTDLDALLAKANISAHSFLNTPNVPQLDMDLLDTSDEVPQSNIESTTYLALSGTHVGLIPEHYAKPWLRTGQLVSVASDRHRVVSRFHALRLQNADRTKFTERAWMALQNVACRH